MVKVICKICSKQCKGEVLKLQDSFFHIDCFKCSECSKTLANESFFTHESKYYCEKDYAKKFGATCAACGRIVDDSSRAVAALGKTFHEPCFRCSRCSATFKPGDKVSLAGSEHLCNQCVISVPGQKQLSTHSRPAGHPMTTSTPLEKQQKVSGLESVPTKPPQQEKSMGYASGPEGVDSLGASDIEEHELLDGNHHPFPGDGHCADDETFSDDDLFVGTHQNGLTVPAGNPSNNSLCGSRSPSYRLNKTVQFEPKFRSQFGQHIAGSYLTHGMSYLRRAGSTPPAGAPPQSAYSKSPHFSRPENFSYRHPAKRFVRGKKGGLVQLMEINARAATDKAAGQLKEEAIKMSHYASGRAPTPQDVPAIERDDFPAPPAPVNVIGHKLRHKDDDGDEDGDAPAPDPKLARDMNQLEQLAKDNSGVAEVILRELQNRALHATDLDPRSASRTPAANYEPHIPTRYMSAMFASPSRFSDHPRSNRFFSTPPPGADGMDGAATMPVGLSTKLEPPMDPKSKTMPVAPEKPKRRDRSLEQNGETHYMSDPDINVDSVLYYKSHYRAATLSDVCPTYLSEQAGLKHLLGQLPPVQQPPTVYSYETLKGGTENKQLPKTADQAHLEAHLSHDEFSEIFHMSRDQFYRQPEWKQNDMKRRAALF